MSFSNYYVVCKDCKSFMPLGDFCDWTNYGDLNLRKRDVRESWLVNSLKLHNFLDKHKFHMTGVVSEHDSVWDDIQDLPWAESARDTKVTYLKSVGIRNIDLEKPIICYTEEA